METMIGIFAVLIVLSIVAYTAFRVQGFLNEKADSRHKKIPAKARSEMINRTSPFKTHLDFETSQELLSEKPKIEKFEPIDFDIDPHSTEIILLARNPYWLFTYWHIEPDSIEHFNSNYGRDAWENYQSYLKLINLTRGKDYFIPITNYANSWYIKVGDPYTQWKICYGKMIPEIGFVSLTESNIVLTPADKPSDIIDSKWFPLEEIWQEMYLKGFYTDIYSEELLKN
jgi:hypothetical protein